jgi:hypothetical protein
VFKLPSNNIKTGLSSTTALKAPENLLAVTAERTVLGAENSLGL